MTKQYRFDATQRVWLDQASDAFNYSDGDSAEDYLYSVLKESADVSTQSAELLAAIKDWPSEYHLSPARHNLLRPFPFKPTDRILELGCGCGAMTRYLAETGATVVAVEGSRRRAAIAAERCRDLPNVTIYCDNIADFAPVDKFDYVTLIGVLEYAPKFIQAPDPVGACLKQAGAFLKDDGALVLAIENQLGLKYLAGCGEDHNGLPFFGVHDLYGAGTAITFGKEELESRLRASGLADASFLYPFPDYKLPNVILTERAFDRADFSVADLLCRSFSRDYAGERPRAFHENLAWQPLARNGLVQDHANSFLVVGRKTRPEDSPRPEWLARIYSSGRLPAFQTETIFLPDGEGVAVAKRALFPEALPPGHVEGPDFVHHPPARAPYVPGRLYAAELQLIMARGGDPAAVARWAAPWVERLVAKAVPGPENVLVLPGGWLDAIPANMVRDGSGGLVDIDLEWGAKAPVPLAWVLVRGLFNSLAACPPSPGFTGLTFREGVRRILEKSGRTLSDEDFATAALFEDSLRGAVFGRDSVVRSFAEFLAEPISSNAPTTFDQEIARLNEEIARVKGTFSWQITKPLRFLAFLGRKVGLGLAFLSSHPLRKRRVIG
ncbi:MAG TPA: methyltransferase domain-containing protein [Ramlibacter sp.]|uniref:class I SAM-dependent methyltransferase n=1 Tax=Ramlibacter sp. TaxID=1917967 RepID=UPI002ED695A2